MKSQIKQHEKIILIDFYTNRIDEEDVKQTFPLTLNHFNISKALFISDGYNNYHDKVTAMNITVNNNIDWNTISTVYRHPKITLSRDKLSCLKDKYNIKVIRDKSKADLEIVSEKTFTTYVSSHYGVSLSSVSSFKVIFDKYKHLFDEKIREDLWKIFDDPTLQDTYIALDLTNSYYHADHIEGTQLADFEDALGEFQTYHLNYIQEEDITNYEYLCNNPNKTVLDTYVNEAASEDSVIINIEDVLEIPGETITGIYNYNTGQVE